MSLDLSSTIQTHQCKHTRIQKDMLVLIPANTPVQIPSQKRIVCVWVCFLGWLESLCNNRMLHMKNSHRQRKRNVVVGCVCVLLDKKVVWSMAWEQFLVPLYQKDQTNPPTITVNFLYGCGKTARVKEDEDSKAEKKSRRQQVKNLNNARQKKINLVKITDNNCKCVNTKQKKTKWEPFIETAV